MTVPLIMTGLLVIGFIAWAIRLSRRQSAAKKEAIAQLAEEQEQLSSFDIHALVRAEVDDLGLRTVNGAEGVPDSVLLKTWNQSTDTVNGCSSRDLLRYVVREGVDPTVATDDDVELICDGFGEAAVPMTEAPAEEESSVAPDLERVEDEG
jgi:hypothetical protein